MLFSFFCSFYSHSRRFSPLHIERATISCRMCIVANLCEHNYVWLLTIYECICIVYVVRWYIVLLYICIHIAKWKINKTREQICVHNAPKTHYIIYPLQNIWYIHTQHKVNQHNSEVKRMDSCAAADNHHHEYLALNVRFMSQKCFNSIANEWE